MNFVEQLTAVALLVDFCLGMTIGMVGGAVHGSLRGYMAPSSSR
jgi:hypothetical protein